MTESNDKPMGPGKVISYAALIIGMPISAVASAYQLFQNPNQVELLRYWAALAMSVFLFLAVFTPKKFAKAVMILCLVLGVAGLITMFTPYGESLFGVGVVMLFSANMIARIHDVE